MNADAVGAAAPPLSPPRAERRFMTTEAEEMAFRIASDRGRDDLITSLPGAQFTSTFAQFSGYLDISPTKRSFYWFTTTRDVSETLDRPLVLWTSESSEPSTHQT